MFKKSHKFLLMVLFSTLSAFVLFSCRISKDPKDPAKAETGDNTGDNQGTGGGEDNQPGEDDSNLLSGEFSVSADEKVKFTKGNLYCVIGDNEVTWNIEDNQYDFRTWKEQENAINGTLSDRGTSENNVGSFYWSKDITKTYAKTNSSGIEADGSFAFENFTINNETYSVLTNDEWRYLIHTRKDGNSSLYGLATITINDDTPIKGCILLPDNWTLPADLSFTSGVVKDGANSIKGFNANKYNSTQWSAMEDAGAVFLPATGYRDGHSIGGSVGSNVNYVGESGYYWSSTVRNTNEAYTFRFNESSFGNNSSTYYNQGLSVRLIKRVKN